MAIEISNKKKKTKSISGVNAFFQVTLFLFFIVGIAYFGVSRLHQSAERRGKEIEATIQARLDEVPEREEIEERIRNYFNLINDFKMVQSKRFLTSYFFEPFQRAVHPNVEIFNASVDLELGRVSFSGKAKDITTVTEQFKGFKEIEYIESVSLSNFSVEIDEALGKPTPKSLVDFSFVIEIDTDLFKENEDMLERIDLQKDSKEEDVVETLSLFDLVKDYWLEIRIEQGELSSYKELEDYFIKHGSESRIEEMKKAKEEIDTMPEEVRNTIAKMAGGPPLSEIESITGDAEGNSATLLVNTKDKKIEGTITLILEKDEWKIEYEEWKHKM